jgi:hypothetical protein
LLDYAEMFRKTRFAVAALCPLLLPPVARADDFTEASGVNLSAEEGFGARHSGMATTFAGFQRDANAVANSPAAMNDVDDFTFATAHAEKFGEAKYDDFALLVPFEARSTMGLGVARYGVSDVEYRSGTHPFQSQPDGLFSTADYLMVAGFARRWGDDRMGLIDVGANLHLLYRQLDQDGIGTRADAMVQYTWERLYRIGALMKGLLPSTAKWESGYAEYESPDIQVGVAAKFPAPYFYGTLEVAYQTEGLFQRRAKSQIKLTGAPVYGDMRDVLAQGNAGAEFLFDFGLSVRFGFTELYLSRDPASLTTFGIGYNWRGIAGLDYSFTPHPDLLASHRISLQFTPSFPKFKGRGFRGRASAPGNPADVKTMPVPARIETSAQPASTPPAAPASAPPSGEKPQSSPAPETEKSPADNSGKEILEQEE